MIQFGDPKFFILCLISFLIITVFRNRLEKKILLFIVNILMVTLFLFYRKKQLIILLVIVFLNYIFTDYIQRKSLNKKLINILILLNLGIFLFFKSIFIQTVVLTFIPSSEVFLRPLGFVGLSFFILRLYSLLTDFKNGDIQKVDFFLMFNYLLYFPSFISGPLDKYDRFSGECSQYNALNSSDLFYSVKRIIIGAFKKIVLSNIVSFFSIHSFNNLDLLRLSPLQIVVALFSYTLYLYFDFSGYSDMAIGISKIFGINLPENFNKPYLSKNVQDFWNRWHVSFMSWLKEYLFYPISRLLISFGLKNPLASSAISILITFIIAGVWHGDGMNFVYYGIYHGIGQSIYIIFKDRVRKKLSPQTQKYLDDNLLIRILSIGFTLTYISMSWFYFLNKSYGVFRILGVEIH